MKISSQKLYNLRDRKSIKINNINKIDIENSPLKNAKQDLTFGANITRLADAIEDGATILFNKANGNISCNNAKKLISNLDNLFGDAEFSQKLKKAGATTIGDTLSIKHHTFFKDDVLRTLLFPVDIFTSMAEKFSKTFNVHYKKDGFVQKLLDNKQKEQARELVLNTLEEFSKNKFDEKLNLSNSFSDFKNTIASNITKTKKGYATRDERTLNRMITSTVSAIYAGWDFHNISMLEKNNKADAKKSRNRRLKQDFTRMGYNAAFTFIALGMFDRYTKKNIILNSIVIAGSALAAEIFSRLKSGTPLKRLTPEEAAKIAQSRKSKKQQAEQTGQQTQQKQKVAFKANAKPENQLFSNFTATNGGIKALEVQNKLIANETITNESTKNNTGAKPKKENKIKKVIGLAFLGATAAFFITKALKGDFKAIGDHKKFIQKYGGDDKNKNYFIDNSIIKLKNLKIKLQNLYKNLRKEAPIKELELKTKTIDIEALRRADKFQEASDLAAEIAKNHKNSTETHSFWENLKKILITKKTSVRTNVVVSELEKLKDDPNAKEIQDLLDTYIDHAKKYASEKQFIDTDKEVFFVSGVVKGFSKIFKTIYDILTIPAKAINGIFENATGANVNRDAFLKANKKLNPSASKYKNELMKIHEMIEKNGNKDTKDLVSSIKNLTRNIETSQETGELANISRTMVTALATWFFVNDYRNTVLIESEGKNIQGAKEQAIERIWHKVFNFIFNGTLMNVFNSTFSRVVNASLLGATVIAAATETTNEFLIRKSLCQPVLPKDSKQEIIDFEIKQTGKSGPWGAWSRFFKKLTGKKSLAQKAGIDTSKKTEETKKSV